MKNLLLHILLMSSLSVFSQDIELISKVLDEEFIELKASSDNSNQGINPISYFPSWTLKGDTTGATDGLEFLIFREEFDSKKKEVMRLLKSDYVTSYDYDRFEKWVLDSLYLEAIYSNIDPTGNDAIPEYLIGNMLVHPEVYYDKIQQIETGFDYSNPFINRELFPFNWHSGLKGIKDNQIIPLISIYDLRPNDRYYGVKEIDDRKMLFQMDRNLSKGILVYRDKDTWAGSSKHPFDLSYNMANAFWRHNDYNNIYVQGLLGTQIQAYLFWLEKEFQRDLDAKNVPYEIKLTLPSDADSKDNGRCEECKTMYFNSAEIDMTEHWRITNEEYWDFCEWVQDSIMLEYIYRNDDPTHNNLIEDEDIADLLDHDDIYYDEVNLSWQEFDPSQPFINRSDWNFKWDGKWKDKSIKESQYAPLVKSLFIDSNFMKKGDFDRDLFRKEKMVYRYTWRDLNRKSKLGELEWDDKRGYYYALSGDGWSTKDLDLGQPEYSTINSGVRRHSRYSDFLVSEDVFIYPGVICKWHNDNCIHEHGDEGRKIDACQICDEKTLKNALHHDFQTQPEATVKNITYDQAKAYYFWRSHQLNPKTKMVQVDFDLIPSEEEFNKVQSGEEIILLPRQIPLPDPVFRYVIHFYEK